MRPLTATSILSTIFKKKRWTTFFASTTLVCPLIFCSCESASQHSPANGNPYAQNEPQTPEEAAYYNDVYSGEWREQTNPFGTGPSVCKKSGSITPPNHWAALPPGAKTLEEIRFESSRRQTAQAGRIGASQAANPFAQAPTQNAYGMQIKQEQYVPQQPTPPQIQAIEYPQAQANPVPQTVQYVSQVPESELTPRSQPTYSAPEQPVQYQPEQSQVAAPQQVPTQPAQYQPVQPQLAAPQVAAPQQVPSQPAQYQSVQPQVVAPQSQAVSPQQVESQPSAAPVYPVPIYQGANWRPEIGDSERWAIIRGQVQEDEEAGDFVDDAETSAAEPAAEVSVELKAENVTTVAASQDVAPQPVASQGAGSSDSVRLPLRIDPSIAAPFAGINRPLPNPAGPTRPNAARSTQDEYVVSGGDSRGETYAREDWSFENLDPEDSVVHFDTVDGQILVEPSNKVFLYSPRFGAVRQIIGPLEGEWRDALQSANSTTAFAEGTRVQTTDVREQELKLLSGNSSVAPEGTGVLSAPAIASGRVGALEADAQLRLGAILTSNMPKTLSSVDAALLLDGSIAAQSWQGEQSVAVSIEMVNAFSNIYIDRAETVFTVENETKTSKLRVIKIANKETARPGELVEFTLRFENVGDEPIGNVTILDNLSARLSYVDGGAKSSVPAQVFAETGETGSLILRWEITEPLEPNEFGVVRFICKVR